MPTQTAANRAEQRQRALQRWDNEGGAGPGRLPARGDVELALARAPPLGNAELERSSHFRAEDP